ncbi:TM1812 family CRISPR-associated protein [Ruminiclostridium herbifermentans]|uniref:TM1812 family CRISPR-associated protein n=1 Tax=Ruminiclostridium herbifermentans TaxID=2488810 RepID=A0A4U7JHZ5_9FIRM|nr:TM1812 family CRISPR-associated protein [Ruminiclostridium herbifermentans]QNU65527.1 TM1812 family CRISPR-associated protein [Ruminiclostridium herbifermentans]
MNENIMILFLSNVRPVKNNLKKYPYKYTETNENHNYNFDIKGVQTNEAAVKTVIQLLHESQKKLSTVYMLCTKTVLDEIKGLEEKHKEFFERRIKEFCEDNKYSCPKFEKIDYDESSKGEKVFNEIINMANKIDEDYNSSDITVYADMTGGMRNSSMLMLSIMRLLQYKGIKIEKVLYSNWSPDTGETYMEIISNEDKNSVCKQNDDKQKYNTIDNITDIYKINNLIAGAEEFVKFGSAQTLTEYFQIFINNNPTSPLSLLIDAMNNFSENLKLCRYGYFKESIDKLKDCINNYRRNALNDINEKIFYLFLSTIKKEYDLLLKQDRTDLDIISWCIEKGYLQQALTLYVEKVPDFIYSNLFPSLDDKELKIVEKSCWSNTSLGFYLINKYILSKNNANYKPKKNKEKDFLEPDKKAELIINRLNNKIVKLKSDVIKYDSDYLKNILKNYYTIKDDRNNSNHASNEKNFKTSEHIKNDLIEYINLLNKNNKNYK